MVFRGAGQRKVRTIAAGALATFALLGLTSCDSGENGDAGAQQSTVPQANDPQGVFGRIPQLLSEVQPSVVAVLTDSGEGSGIVFQQDGVIVTNQHVVANADQVRVAFADGERVPAEVVAGDELTDVAVLRVDRDSLPAADFATELPEVGALAVALGNPLGFENTATAGIVSGLHRSIPGSARQSLALVDLIQTDAAISPGNSGGALISGDGQVVGMNVAFIPPQANAVAIGFAIPSETVVDVANQLLEDGTVEHVFFGIQPGRITPQIAERLGLERRGVLVLDVVEGGPAAEAGVEEGDLITSIAGTDVGTVEEFLGALRRQEPGDQVTVGIVRDGETQELRVELTERPPASS